MSSARFLRLTAVLACQIACALPSYAADYRVHLVDPPITNHAILADDPLPPVCRPISDVALHGCRGQALPVSFVVTASKPLEQVRIEVSQVGGEGRTWSADAVDVHVVKDFYRNTIFGHMAAMPSLLVHDDSFLAIEPAPKEVVGRSSSAGQQRESIHQCMYRYPPCARLLALAVAPQTHKPLRPCALCRQALLP